MLHCFNKEKENENECKSSMLDKFKMTNKADIYEDEKTVQILIDCPGVNKANIKISMQNEYLYVDIERIQGFQDLQCTHQEISYGKTTRKFYLGEKVTNKIIAKLENGVLYISYEKSHTNEVNIEVN